MSTPEPGPGQAGDEEPSVWFQIPGGAAAGQPAATPASKPSGRADDPDTPTAEWTPDITPPPAPLRGAPAPGTAGTPPAGGDDAATSAMPAVSPVPEEPGQAPDPAATQPMPPPEPHEPVSKASASAPARQGTGAKPATPPGSPRSGAPKPPGPPPVPAVTGAGPATSGPPTTRTGADETTGKPGTGTGSGKPGTRPGAPTGKAASAAAGKGNSTTGRKAGPATGASTRGKPGTGPAGAGKGAAAAPRGAGTGAAGASGAGKAAGAAAAGPAGATGGGPTGAAGTGAAGAGAASTAGKAAGAAAGSAAAAAAKAAGAPPSSPVTSPKPPLNDRGVRPTEAPRPTAGAPATGRDASTSQRGATPARPAKGEPVTAPGDKPAQRPGGTPQTWQGLVSLITGGRVHPRPSEEQRARLQARIAALVGRNRRIAIIALKGGVGKTTTTACLGAVLAEHRQDRIVAVDANPDAGTLGYRIRLETTRTAKDLLAGVDEVEGYADMRAHASQTKFRRLEVIASDVDPTVDEAFGEEDYRDIASVLERFYGIVLTDCGPGLLHSAMRSILPTADELVVISAASLDGSRAASLTLDWLEQHDYAKLAREAVVVINAVRPRSLVDVDQLQQHFERRCRAVLQVPFDRHLETGSEIIFDQLAPATRHAYLELAAAVIDGIAAERG
jgi:MinD-like ATPase involved in chromosome partitioning or flagellar assembly